MRAELDLYSGRPNPGWSLSAIEAEELVRRVDALPHARGVAVRDSLGYRGVVVRAESSDPPTPFAELMVSAGAVRVTDRQRRETWKGDPGRSLERWLVDSARARIDASIVNVAAADLDGSPRR